jgi:hypothetical protein
MTYFIGKPYLYATEWIPTRLQGTPDEGASLS